MTPAAVSADVDVLVHVLGAMLLAGGAVVALGALVAAGRGGDGAGTAALTRTGFRALLFVGLPGYVLLRVSAELIAPDGGTPAWIGIGYGVADGGLLLLLIALVLTGLSSRRLGRDPAARGPLNTVAAALLALALVLYVVAIWAMTTKPV